MNAKQLVIDILALPPEAQLRILRCMLLGKERCDWSSKDPAEVVVAANRVLSSPFDTSLGGGALELVERALEDSRRAA